MSRTIQYQGSSGGSDVEAQPSPRVTGAYDRWFGRPVLRFAWLALIIAVVHPPHGTGLTICWMKSTTGLSCPGCGATRSLSCAARGMFQESWAYHPFGAFLLGFFGLCAGISLLTTARRRRLAKFIESHARPSNALYFTLVAAFIAFGLGRAVFQLAVEFAGNG